MATKRSSLKKRKDKPTNWTQKPLVLQVRGSKEFADWIDELARYDGGSDLAKLTENAFTFYARFIGFTKIRPQR